MLEQARQRPPRADFYRNMKVMTDQKKLNEMVFFCQLLIFLKCFAKSASILTSPVPFIAAIAQAESRDRTSKMAAKTWDEEESDEDGCVFSFIPTVLELWGLF